MGPSDIVIIWICSVPCPCSWGGMLKPSKKVSIQDGMYLYTTSRSLVLSLCPFHEVTVNDNENMMFKAHEWRIFKLLLLILFIFQLPNGRSNTQQSHQDKITKLQDITKHIEVHFKKLRLLYDKCIQISSGVHTASGTHTPSEVSVKSRFKKK